MPVHADPRSVVTDFIAALEALDIDKVLTYVSDDIVYQNVPLKPARGIKAFEKQMRLLPQFATGFKVQMHAMAADGPVVLTERTDVIESRAFRAAFWVCGTFEVYDGKITLWRDYADWTTVLLAGTKGIGLAVAGGVRRVAALARRR